MRSQTARTLLRSALTVAGLLALYAVIPVPGQREPLWFTLVMALGGLAFLAYAFITLAQRAQRSTDETAIRRGLVQVNWPGRWQRLTVAGRHLILDASHNPEGAQVLEENLRRVEEATGSKPIIVAGALGEFRARALLEVVARHAREIHIVSPQQARATPYADMVRVAPPAARPLMHENSVAGIFPDAATCTLGGPGDTVIVTGSIYLLGEIMERLEPARGAGEGKLQDF